MTSHEKINFIEAFVILLLGLWFFTVVMYFIANEKAPLGSPPAIQEHSSSTPRALNQ